MTDITRAYMMTYISVVVICDICGITILSRLSEDMGSEEELKRFVRFIMSYIAFVSSNGVCVYANVNRIGVFLGTIFTIINLSAVCFCVFEWFLFIENKLESKFLAKTKGRLLFAFPLFVLIIILVSSPWTKLVFYYDAAGMFQRGPLYIAIIGMSGIYLLHASFHLLINLKYADTPKKRREHIILMLFLVFPITAGIIDYIIPHLPVLELLALLGIVVIFTGMQNEQIYVDTLTGLHNRRGASEYLQEHLFYASPDNPVHIFIVDVDDFKKVNDLYGHAEGDNVMKLIASVINEFHNEYGFYTARWGGDEFVLLFEGELDCEPSAIIERLNRRLQEKCEELTKPYNLKLSGGYSSTYDRRITEEAIFKSADEVLYENKKKNLV